jgi:tetratricopeptide (TPR) repeat protein
MTVMIAVALALALQGTGAVAVDAAAVRREAFALAYNLDYEQAVARLSSAVAERPDEASLQRSLAAVVWTTILYQRGAVTVEHFSGGITSRVRIEKPAPELDRRFRDAVERAIALSEARLRIAPSDPEAHYELGAAVGLKTLYIATVEGGTMSAIRLARRAFDEHEKVLELDVRRKDAGLIVGSYRYAVSLLSAPMRLMAYIVGFGGGRERGLKMIEEASEYPGDAQPEALFGLLLLYNRERRYADALRIAGLLQQRYPRNRLLLLEEGATALRAGDAARAARVLDHGITALNAESRPLAAGERVLWHLKRGTARLRLGQRELAAEDLRIAEQDAGSPAWVRGRVRLELGKLADLAGNRQGASARYGEARRLCEAGHDRACVDEARRLERTPYQR